MKNMFCNIVTIIVLLLLGSIEASAQDCYQPYPLEEVFGTPSVDNITTNSATLHWYDPNLEMEPTAQLHWIVLYSTSNLTNPNPANGTQVSCNATDPMDVNCTLTGLQPGTAYNCYVWTSCSSTSISEGYATISFRTACATIAAPYSENFDAYTSFAQPDCWMFAETSVSAGHTFPLVNNIGTARALNFRNQTCAALPTLSNPINTLRISFSAMTDAAGTAIVVGVMTDPNDLSTFDSIGSVTLSSTYAWSNHEMHLNTYSGSGHNIAFRYSGNSNQNFYIDDIHVEEMSGCLNPVNLAVSSLSANQATITWTESGTATQWRTLISTTPITNFNNQNPQTASYPSYNASNLLANTTYYFYVQSVCGGNDYSDWSSLTFTTQCGVSILPATEDFAYTIGGSLPSCWDKVLVSGSLGLSVTSGDATIMPQSGTGMIQLNSAIAQSGAQIRLISNALSTMGASALDVDFWWFHDLAAPTAMNEGVRLQYSFDGTNWTNSSHGQILRYSDIYTGWTEYHVIIPEVGNHSRVYVGFLFTSGRGSNCYLDNVTFQAASGCYTPAGLVATNVQGNSADFSWTEVGFANSWNLVISETPISDFSSQTPITVNTTSYSANNLNPRTTYYAYVQANCSATEHSNWSPAAVFTTGCGNILYLPYREDFDDYGTCSSAFPECWTRPMTYTYSANGCTTPSATDLSAYSGGNSLLFCSASNGQIYAITPGIAEDISHVAMTFFLYFENQPLSGTMEIGLMSDPSDYATFQSVETITPTSQGVWVCHRISFADAAVTGTGYHIAFRHTGASDLRYCLVDQVIIQYAADCWDAVNPIVSNVTGNSATISWTDINDQPADWHLKISDVPLVSMSGVANVLDTVISATTFSVDYLIGNTTYYYYIASDCGNNQMSNWVNGYFTTELCNCYVTLHLQNVTTNSAWNGARIAMYQGGDQIGAATVPNGQWAFDTLIYTCSAAPITYAFFTGTYEEGYAFQIVDSENNTLYTHPADQTMAGGTFLTASPVCGEDCSEAPVLTATNSGGHASLTWTAIEDASSYVVYRDNQEIASYITSTHYVDNQPLTNSVCYTVAPVCITGEGAISNSSCVVGMDDYENAAALKIYPNPAHESLTIVSEEPFSRIEITNMLGQICYSKAVNGTQIAISLANFNDGMYLLKVWNDGRWVVRKFVVKN